MNKELITISNLHSFAPLCSALHPNIRFFESNLIMPSQCSFFYSCKAKQIEANINANWNKAAKVIGCFMPVFFTLNFCVLDNALDI